MNTINSNEMEKFNPKKHNREDYISKIIESKSKPAYRVLVGVPMTGLVRAEWVRARYGQIIPTNWSHADIMMFLNQHSPLKYTVADARNLVVDVAMRGNYEWLIFIDHDVIIPPTFFVIVNERILHEDVPCWSGLYFTKSVPAEPLIYRGRGNGYFTDFKIGDKVWVDGLPMGCTIISCKLIREIWRDSDYYRVEGQEIKRVFITPNDVFIDPENLAWYASTGTEDLNFCSRIIKGRYFDKAGYHKYQIKQFPFLIDTTMYCKHIDNNGQTFPMKGEEKLYMKEKRKKKK